MDSNKGQTRIPTDHMKHRKTKLNKKNEEESYIPIDRNASMRRKSGEQNYNSEQKTRLHTDIVESNCMNSIEEEN
jgi:hypothetical protein